MDGWCAVFQVLDGGTKRLYSIEVTMDKGKEVVANHELSADDFSLHIVKEIGELCGLVERLR